MGWTGQYDDRPAYQVVTEEIESGGWYKVIARSGRFYAAKQVANADGPVEDGKVFGIVALIQTERKGGGKYIMTKLVDESMGPLEYAPLSILNKLSEPAPNEYAANWRQRSREYAAAKAAVPKITKGDVIEMESPVKFSSGFTSSRFRFEGDYNFRALPSGVRVRLNKTWKTSFKWNKVDLADRTIQQMREGAY